MNEPEAMKLDFYVRWYKDGKWQSVNVQDLSEAEFRQYICWKIGLVGMKKDVEHWTVELGVSYDTPVLDEPKQCPSCGSTDIGRTAEVVSLYRSPLMCRKCLRTFGGNLEEFFKGMKKNVSL